MRFLLYKNTTAGGYDFRIASTGSRPERIFLRQRFCTFSRTRCIYCLECFGEGGAAMRKRDETGIDLDDLIFDGEDGLPSDR